MNNDCFTPPILEEAEKLVQVTFLTKEILGVDDRETPPQNGMGRNLIVKYPVSGHVYMYDAVGIPTLLNSIDVVMSIDDKLSLSSTNPVQNKVVTAALNAEQAARSAEDEALYNQLQSEVQTRATTDEALAQAISAASSGAADAVGAETSARQAADQVLEANISSKLNAPTVAGTEGQVLTVGAGGSPAWEDQTGPYTLPVATASTLGGVKFGSNVNFTEDGTITLAGAGSDSVAVGASSVSSASGSVSLGNGAVSDQTNSVALGYLAKTTRDGELSVGDQGSSVESYKHRYVSNVRAGELDEDAVNFKQMSDALSEKANASDLSDLDGTVARLDADVQTIGNAIDKTVMTDMALDSTASTTVVKFNKSYQNIKSGDTSSLDVPLPVASETQAGVMNAAAYTALQNASEMVDIIINASVQVDGLPASPTQEELTTAWENASGKTQVVNGAKINDSTNSKVWTYYSNASAWSAVDATATVTVSQATNTSLGIVKGSEEAGQAFVESDGTLSVNDWDNTMARIANLEDNPYVLPITQSTGDSETDVMSQSAVTTALGGKQDNLSVAQLSAVNSGVTASTVIQVASNTTTINGKQDALNNDQLAAVNSGITADKVATYDGYESAIAGKQATLSSDQLAATNSGITSAKVETYDGYAATIAGKADASSLAAVATTGAYSSLTGTPTIPAAANNGTLTIQQNGTQVATFGANQASNATANITVPTITVTSTDPGEGVALAANNFIAVVEE